MAHDRLEARAQDSQASWEVERSLWYARWAAAAVAALQAWLFQPAPPAPDHLIEATFGLAGVLAAANLAVLPALRRRRVSHRLAVAAFSVDLLVVVVLVWLYLYDPSASQWVLFMIVQLEAAYRWEMRGALGTAIATSAAYAAARWQSSARFDYPFTVDSLTYVLGLTLVQALVVGGMARKLRAERDASQQLHEAALALNAGLESPNVLPAVAEEAARTTGAEIVVVWLPSDGGFTAAATVGLSDEERDVRLPEVDPMLGASTVTAAHRSGEPVLSTTCPQAAALEATVLPKRWRTAMSVPILQEDQTIGVLSCYVDGRQAPSPETLSRVQALAALASVAITNAAAYQRERSALESLRAVDRLKDDFLSTISHELRTPVTVVEGFATTLRSRWDDLAEDRRQELVRRIEAQSAGLRERIGDLLEFSRLRSGEYQPRLSSFALAPLVSETVHRLDPTLTPHQVAVDVPAGLTVYADPTAVAQILENLLVNAARYSPPEAPIEVRAAAELGFVEISVSDEGYGIPPEEQDRIFERFYRGQQDEVRAVRGTGVGLAIVRELAQLLGGTVRVSSAVGEGSTFTVRLPEDESQAPGAGQPLSAEPATR